jgi:general secretion pathway protein A
MFEHFYGLTANPFQLTPDPRFYFESLTHRKALSYLGYGLAQGEGFIVITGEIGAGKTTLVGHLMATVDKARLTAANIVTSALDGEDMIGMAAESFGIDTRGMDKPATLRAIETLLHAEARAGRRCLLVVDEAQNLSIEALEELRMLSNFQLGASSLLQIFLLGQPEFRARINSEPRLEQLRQRVIASHHLDAMEPDEVEPYIVHRLSKVGWNGRPDITPGAVRQLYSETGGVPRKLNVLLSRLFLMGAVEQTDMLDEMMLGRVLADQRGDFADTPMVAPEYRMEERAVPVAVTQTVAPPVAAPIILPEPAPEYAAAPLPIAMDAAELVPELADAKARIAELEARVSEQDASLRRILTMLINWAEHDKDVEPANVRAA